ncbi:uncharacterized protein LOC143216748 [Lasioglossum baleicum]|uniref:uncharacterized protein LOC143216748 n=1 Tax=Lasioglossum baleicum TaxID=434251 RepID=UPI003FCD4AB2
MSPLRYNFSNLPSTIEAAIAFAREHGILRSSKKCRMHHVDMKFFLSPTMHENGRYRCPVGRGKCRQYSGTVDSMFEEIRLPMYKAIRLLYCFTRDFSDSDTVHELYDFTNENDASVSLTTVAAWHRFCREIIVDEFTQIQVDKPKLGGISDSGDPIAVQIDETRFGKKNYKRGTQIEGQWLLGMVDVETGDCRMVVMQNRTAENLISAIKKNVAMGSEIHTDCFRSYPGLTTAGYTHVTVNHTIEFVASNGTCTLGIEPIWRPAKQWMREDCHLNNDDFAYRLCENLWRRFCRHNTIDLMASLMEAIRMHYVFK